MSIRSLCWVVSFFAWVSACVADEDSNLPLAAELETFIQHIEYLQELPGGMEGLNRRLNAEIDRVEIEVLDLDRQLEAVKNRFADLSNSSTLKTPDHWAYIKPERASIPDSIYRNRVRNPIDSFIFHRLEVEGLPPSPEAIPEKLIRRVYLDLIGLPPTLKELNEFLRDDSPNAYEEMVDRLLDSPHYGERQAETWLDLARCSDSCGYHIDANRPMWPYREWVIQAFNRDLPFDQFTILQLAGDLLPNPSDDTRIATGFHRNTLFNEEGGIDAEEFRTKAVADRVSTTATVWMGTTMACAECHDHKYDPISQKEFFEFYAFFNNTSELGGGTFASRAPLIHLFEGNQKADLNRLTEEIEQSQGRLDTHTPALTRQQVAWEETMMEGIDWETVEIDSVESESGSILTEKSDHSWAASGIVPVTDIYRLEGTWRNPTVTALRLEIIPLDDSGGSNGVARSDQGIPALGEVRLLTAPHDGTSELTATKLLFPSWNTDRQVPKRVVDGNPRSAWILDATDTEVYEAWFEIPESSKISKGSRFVLELDQRAGNYSSFVRFRLTATSTDRPVRLPPKKILEILELKKGYPKGSRRPKGETKLANLPDAKSREPDRGRSFDQEKKLSEYFRSVAPSLDETRTDLETLTQEKKELLKKIPQALVMGENTEPRMTNIHIRGDFLRPGNPVTPDVPDVFGTFPPILERTRLGLAKWLVSEENPLTARVAMNRLWQQIFGRGIVETSEDFGIRGAPPTHPDLLDWLALEFMDRGWSTKEMIRLIVLSSTYRQSSKVAPDLYNRDPYNRLLARGPRFRLSAEGIRDNALAVSGLLNRNVGGASVFPVQPAGIWSQIGSPGYGVDEWIVSEGVDRHRRGLYTYWRRSNPYPSFTAFDAPSREYCTVQRPITNTPLQALVTLNDPVFLEAASEFANRILEEGAETPHEMIDHAYRLSLSRQPTPIETEKLMELYKSQLEKYETVSFENGESEKNLGAAAPENPRHAAWTIVCQVILNLDETLTKG